jgi:SAM-dependent methyltransferase
LSKQAGLPINVVSDYSEKLPFMDCSFDLVHCRQVLHHAQDLKRTCGEIGRVLKPGGMLVSTREHVISKREDLETFLHQHPLHNLYGGENAYLLLEYQGAIRSGGLRLIKTLAPFDSAINYFPVTDKQMNDLCVGYLARISGRRIATHLTADKRMGSFVIRFCRKAGNILNHSPGRLYSFVAIKPYA